MPEDSTFRQFKLDPNNVCTFNGTNIESVVDFSYTETGTQTNANAQGNQFVQGVYSSDKHATVTINTTDGKQLSAFSYGQKGELVLKGVLLASDETGYDTGTTIVVTYTNAVVGDINNSVTHADSNASISFTIFDNGNTALGTIA